MFDISSDVSNAILYNYEESGTINIKLFEVTINVTYVLYSCLLYPEIYILCYSTSIRIQNDIQRIPLFHDLTLNNG